MSSSVLGLNHMSTSNRVRVYKNRGIGCKHCRPVIKKPWNVIAPYWPTESFVTFEEAMAHARKWRPPILMNVNQSVMLATEIRRREGTDAA